MEDDKNEQSRSVHYEMKWDDEVPVGVAINEAVELAKMFSSDEAPSFINGVLGKIARSLEETKE